MRYLFLDLDGVVNSAEYFARSLRTREALLKREHTPADRLIHQVDPGAVVHLNAIVKASGCVIVISSSWRLVHPLGAIRRALQDRGFEYTDSIIGKTGYSPVGDSTNRRGLEIQAWLETAATANDVAILDDDRDMGPLLPRLVHTTWDTGLLAEHVAPTLHLLGIE